MGTIDDKDVAAQIRQLYDLHQSGALSKAEFENAKRRLLGGDPPRMIAQPPPTSQYQQPKRQPRSPGKVLAFCVLALLVIWGIGSSLGSGDDDVEPTPTTTSTIGQASRNGATPIPTDPPDPTATAIPRTGVQTIHLAVTVQDDWKAWGQGCVGSGPADWVSADNGVAVAPSDATGSAQGQVLGTGNLSEDETQCQWSAKVTTRASDSYVIAFDGERVVCHSNMMFPTDGGFFAAVIVADGQLQCASVVDVADGTATPAP